MNNLENEVYNVKELEEISITKFYIIKSGTFNKVMDKINELVSSKITELNNNSWYKIEPEYTINDIEIPPITISIINVTINELSGTKIMKVTKFTIVTLDLRYLMILSQKSVSVKIGDIFDKIIKTIKG